MSLKSFCQNPVLSWAIRYSLFQFVKFTSSFEFCLLHNFFNSLTSGGQVSFLSNKKIVVFPFGRNKHIIILSFFKKNVYLFFFVGYYISKYVKNKIGYFFFFLKKLKIMMSLFHPSGKTPLFYCLKKFINYMKTWPPDVKKLKKLCGRWTWN